ncbi:PIP49 C domain containing protein [Trichuris trichiura]|uniref:PIP49 C domain containing protein n=1 Tax=Trichuris trichiura TaxID=36087 RepID=A0A077Z5L1_TRITR|nr:PIP49 C domain containing protein [Trichuris trichiura]
MHRVSRFTFGESLTKPCAILTPVAVIPLLMIILELFLGPTLYRAGHQQTAFLRRSMTTDDLESTSMFFQLESGMQWRFRPNVRGFNASKPLLDCEQISRRLRSMAFLTDGWMKTVYHAHLGNRSVAVKLVNANGEMMRRCLAQSGPAESLQHKCRETVGRKFVKEIVALNQFRHSSIIELIGYCIPMYPSDEGGFQSLAVVSELGEPMNLVQLLQLSWESRLKLFLSLVRLLDFLANHPAGPIVLNDFRAQQFVVVNGEFKLVDFDDIGLEEPSCQSQADCDGHLTRIGIGNATMSVRCIHGSCNGFNDAANIYKTVKHFLFLLQHGVPPSLQQQVDNLMTSFRTLSLPSSSLKRLTNDLVENYATGQYFNKRMRIESSGFVKYLHADLPSLHDYPCRDSYTQTGCVISVANLHEAKYLCSIQVGCLAIVWTGQQSWTGRKVVHFKSNFTNAVYSPETAVYVKLSR